MPLAVFKKVSGIVVGDQIFARGEEKQTLLLGFGLGLVSDHEEANLVGGSREVIKGREGSENGGEVISE